MADSGPTREEILESIRRLADTLKHPPSRREFKTTGLAHHVPKHFESWNAALLAAGFQQYTENAKLQPEQLLADWARVVRQKRRIPTREEYLREGEYSPGVFSKKFGPWSTVPEQFRSHFADNGDFTDVIALLPAATVRRAPSSVQNLTLISSRSEDPIPTHSRLPGRQTYGAPLDFRGLRHEPVNENGVVFLFGMVARELGYLVEAVQAAFPDCDAKRQVGPGKWQRVRIEFEFESRNFRDHGHAVDGCDVIVCWSHNWSDCPIEVVELCSVIRELAPRDD